MGYGVQTTERERYVSALAGLWQSLSSTLARLDSIAAKPGQLDDAVERLPALQYGLHRAGELVAGIEPPTGAEGAHAQLASALRAARDATGEVRDVLEAEGAAAAAFLVHEWRGALFGVRLARHQLSLTPLPEPRETKEPHPPAHRSAAMATVLVIAGTAAFTAGAVAVLWPVWVVGFVLVALSVLIYEA